MKRLADLEGRRVGIWGFAREGRAALAALRSRAPSADVAVYTPEPPEDADGAAARFVSGPDPVASLRDRDVVIRSPGVSLHQSAVEELRRAGVAFTSGTNLWFGEVGAGVPVVAVTGTKGKSTTSSLIAHLARDAGIETQLGGNVGVPLLALLDEPAPELRVVELSSFQIADLETAPAVAVVLNLYREHLDWHGDEERYHEDKLRILSLSESVVPVLNARDERLRERGAGDPRTRWFGDERGTHVAEGRFVTAGGRALAEVADLPLLGDHNVLNACAALEALEVLGSLGRADVPRGLRTFRPLAHRLEEVSRAGGRLWVNDSISTTPQSAVAGIRSFPDRHLTIIVGGYDRGQHYEDLTAAITAHAPDVVAIALPDNGPRIVEGLAGIETRVVADLGEGIAAAAELTPEGGVVLLSPGAPSFSAYRNFEERGEHFRELARAPRP